jgi:hypothetical protein
MANGMAYRGPDQAVAVAVAVAQAVTVTVEDANASSSGREEIQRVFAHWVRATGRPANVRLTPKRKAAIKARLKSFSPDDLVAAIDGVMLSDHHQQKPEWTDLVSCFGSDEKVENHLARASGRNGHHLTAADRRIINYRKHIESVDLNSGGLFHD